MVTSNRDSRLANLRRPQPKMPPYKGYEYYAGGRGSNKESAMLARIHETITERNDSLDALEYSIVSAVSAPVTTSSSTTVGTMRAFGSLSSSDTMLFTPSGEMGPYTGSVVENAEQIIASRQTRQSQDLLRCVYMLSHVLQSLTERRIELDNSGLRTLEPFEYRIRMNQLDELFMFVTHLMDNMSIDTRPEELRKILTEKGLI